MPGQILTSVWAYVSGESYQAPFVTPSPMPSLISTTITTPTSALCDGIPVIWQNTDVEVISLLGVTPVASTLTTSYSSMTASTSQLVSLAPTSSSAPPVLSTSDIITLGCSIGIGLPATLATLYLCWLKIKKPRQVR